MENIRALRRHHYRRLQKARKNYWGYGCSYGREQDEMDAVTLGQVATTPCSCSCWICGNKTENHGKRFQWVKVLRHSDDDAKGD